MDRPLILLSNDDGIHSVGLHALVKVLTPHAKLFIVAPHMERSATSHAITIHMPLYIEKLAPIDDCNQVYSVNGTPADCVKIACDKILPRVPDFVFSGINRGANVADDVFYSGTVGAAMEGVLSGATGVALSCFGGVEQNYRFDTATKVVQKLVCNLEKLHSIGKRVLNINIPSCDFEQISGFVPSVTGKWLRKGSYQEYKDTRQGKCYWIEPVPEEFVAINNCDCDLVRKGFVTTSLLQPSMLDAKQEQLLQPFLSVFN